MYIIARGGPRLGVVAKSSFASGGLSGRLGSVIHRRVGGTSGRLARVIGWKTCCVGVLRGSVLLHGPTRLLGGRSDMPYFHSSLPCLPRFPSYNIPHPFAPAVHHELV